MLTADLSDPVALATVEARVSDSDRPVDLVVNNAGFGTVGQFADLPIEREQQEIELNVLALVRLTHAAVDAQLARGARWRHQRCVDRGYQPTPENATYGATKAYVRSFSQAVHEELKGTGVKCMVLAPGFTRTEFQTNAGFDSERGAGLPLAGRGDRRPARAARLRQGPGDVRAGPAERGHRRVHCGDPARDHPAHRRGHRARRPRSSRVQAGSTRETVPLSDST